MRCLAAILAAVSLNAGATTLYVDGVGTSPEHFTTIRGALLALGSSGEGTDGASDEIRVMVNRLTEPGGFAVNGNYEAGWGFEPMLDDLTIEGDGDSDGIGCVADFTAPFSQRDCLRVVLRTGQRFTARNMTMMLTYGSLQFYNFISVEPSGYIWPDWDTALTLDHVIVTASGPGNVPLDPDKPHSPRTAIIADDFGEFGALRVYWGGGTPLPITITDCLFALQFAPGVTLDLGTGDVEITHTRISSNGIFIAPIFNWGWGLRVTSSHGVSLRLEDVTIDRNYDAGLIAEAPKRAGEQSEFIVEGNSAFVDNGLARVVGPGTALRARAGGELLGSYRLEIQGTPSAPVRFSGTGLDIFLRVGSSALVRHAAFEDVERGITFTGESLPPASGNAVVRNCLFLRGLPWSSVYVSQHYPGRFLQAAGAVSASFENCTFFDTLAGVDPPVLVDLNTARTLSDADGTRLAFTDCIFAGTGDETAFDLTYQTDVEIALENCALALDGPHRLAGLLASPAVPIDFSRCITADPWFVTTGLASCEDAFDIQSVMYGHAGPGGGPLTGWGDYVGGLPDELSGFQLR